MDKPGHVFFLSGRKPFFFEKVNQYQGARVTNIMLEKIKCLMILRCTKEEYCSSAAQQTYFIDLSLLS